MPPYVGFPPQRRRAVAGTRIRDAASARVAGRRLSKLQKCGKRLSACESSRHLTARRGVDSSQVQISPSSIPLHVPLVTDAFICRKYRADCICREFPQFETTDRCQSGVCGLAERESGSRALQRLADCELRTALWEIKIPVQTDHGQNLRHPRRHIGHT